MRQQEMQTTTSRRRWRWGTAIGLLAVAVGLGGAWARWRSATAGHAVVTAVAATAAQRAEAAVAGAGHPVATGPAGPELVAVRGLPTRPTAILFVQRLRAGSQLWHAVLHWGAGGVRASGLHTAQPATPATMADLTAYRNDALYLASVQGQDQSVVVTGPSGAPSQVFALVPPGEGGTVSVTRAGLQVRWRTAAGVTETGVLQPGSSGLVSATPARLQPATQGAANISLFVRVVETTRRVLGPAPVAIVEDAWYGLRNVVRRVAAYLQPPAPVAVAVTGPKPAEPRVGRIPSTMRSLLPSRPRPAAPAFTATAVAVPAAWPLAAGEGRWTPAGPTIDGAPSMERTFVLPDASQPAVRVDLVWMNAHVLHFHLVAGTTNPHAASGIHGPGQVPAAALPHLVAAFDGNFKRIQGQYSGFGFRADNVTYIPPTVGLATFAVYADGEVALGSWGTDILPTPLPNNLMQNLSLIVDNGQVVPSAITSNASRWGLTVGNAIRVWRSALGITANGNLIYAAGPITTAQNLALALRAAGAVRAMELDINSYWVTFNFYHDASGVVSGTKLISTMTRSATRYVSAPDARDFVYVTAP